MSPPYEVIGYFKCSVHLCRLSLIYLTRNSEKTAKNYFSNSHPKKLNHYNFNLHYFLKFLSAVSDSSFFRKSPKNLPQNQFFCQEVMNFSLKKISSFCSAFSDKGVIIMSTFFGPISQSFLDSFI